MTPIIEKTAHRDIPLLISKYTPKSLPKPTPKPLFEVKSPATLISKGSARETPKPTRLATISNRCPSPNFSRREDVAAGKSPCLGMLWAWCRKEFRCPVFHSRPPPQRQGKNPCSPAISRPSCIRQFNGWAESVMLLANGSITRIHWWSGKSNTPKLAALSQTNRRFCKLELKLDETGSSFPQGTTNRLGLCLMISMKETTNSTCTLVL